MIQAIIFDCFGVLTTDAWLPFKEQYFAHDPSLLKQATDLNKQTDAGLIGFDDFIRSIAALAHQEPQAVAATITTNVANEPLFTYIETLRPKYKIGMLSNVASNWLETLFTAKQLKLFDAQALSYETGFIKPQPRAYEIITERLEVEPEACVLIDDQLRYCDGGRDAGMQAIHYRELPQMITALDKLLASDY